MDSTRGDALCSHIVDGVHGEGLKRCNDQGIARQNRNALSKFRMH
jgi:hypothetical protein